MNILTDFSSLTLNKSSKYYHALQGALQTSYRDYYWPEDAIFMERNSRDFMIRNGRINENAEMLCSILQSSPLGILIFIQNESAVLIRTQ